MNIKITKHTVIKNWANQTSDGYVVLVHGKILNDDETRQKKFKFVLYNDSNDVWDYYNSELDYGVQSNENFFDKHFKSIRKSLIDEQINGMIDQVKSYDDCSYFFELCNDSINYYNERLA